MNKEKERKVNMTTNNFSVPSRMYTDTYSEEKWYINTDRGTVGKIYTSPYVKDTLSDNIVMNPKLSKFHSILVKAGLAKEFGIPGKSPRTIFVPCNESIADLNVNKLSIYECKEFVFNRMIRKNIILSYIGAKLLLYQSEGEFSQKIQIVSNDQYYFYNMNRIKQIDVVCNNGIMNIY